jgi:hypothetical protein
MNIRIISAFVIAIMLLVAMSGCGGGTSQMSQAAAPQAVVPQDTVAPVSISVSPSTVSLGASETMQFAASVTQVIWSISACSAAAACGTISTTGLYTAPTAFPGSVTVTVKATANADSTKSATATVFLIPVKVSITPRDFTVIAPGATLNFTAAVHDDPKSAGVIWSLSEGCSAATCGTLSSITGTSVTYTAPAAIPDPPTITLTATSVTNSGSVATVLISLSLPRALTEGDYAFSYNGWRLRISGGYYTMYRAVAAGHFHADSAGNITDGVQDVNLDSGVSQSMSFTGSYAIGADGRGTISFITPQGTFSYFTAVHSSGTKGNFVETAATEESTYGAGYFELQDKAAFSLPALSGPYAVGMFGTLGEWTRMAAVGQFTADSGGAFSTGMMDMAVATYVGSQLQTNYPKLTLSGSFTAPSSSTGRGTVTLSFTPTPDKTAGTFNFAYYVISDQKILLAQSDARAPNIPVLSGELRRQTSPFSVIAFNSPVIFSMAGSNNAIYGGTSETAAVGRIVPNGSGLLTGTIDATDVWPTLINDEFSGSYSSDSDGRLALTLQTQPARTWVAYFYAPNEGFLMETLGTDVLFGKVKPQTGGPFSAASISGTFLTNTVVPNSESSFNYCGFTTFDGAGAFTTAMDGAEGYEFVRYTGTGTYDVSATGRGSFTSGAYGNKEFWVISPTELAGIYLFEYRK